MDAWRVGRQDEPHGRSLGLVAHHHAAAFQAVAVAEDVQIQTARQRVEHLIHVREDEEILLHVRPAHVLGQAGRGRLHVGELVGRLRAITQGERGVQVQLAGFLDSLDQLVAGDGAQGLAGLRRFAHVALQQAGIGLAHFSDRLAGHEVDDFVDFQRLVGLAPAQDRNVQHGRSSVERIGGFMSPSAVAPDNGGALSTLRRSWLRRSCGRGGHRLRRPTDI